MSFSLIDSHCHLNCLAGAHDRQIVDNYLAMAKQSHVSQFLCVSIDWETLPEVLSLAAAYGEVWASVGVHPNHRKGVEPSLTQLLAMADNTKVIAIGETGLDYFRSEGELDWQKARFRRHIQAARQTNKPLIIHSRDAKQDTLAILEQAQAAEVGGVMHCFTEDWEMAQAAMAMNFYISFSGIVTFKSAKTLQDVAKKMPIDKILIETDSPYLAPVPYRGQPNQPAYVKYVAEYIAHLRGEPIAYIAEKTTENFHRLFNIPARV